MNKFRISAGGIIIKNNRILLAKYKDQNNKPFLVGPGGGIKANENFAEALIREVYEETRFKVNPIKILLAEEISALKYRVLKIWFLCNINTGKLTKKTPEAQKEGILDINWYNQEQLKNEIVYPSIIKNFDWKQFSNSNWQTQYIESKTDNF
ncbi:NUDIX domain-containing protein [Candidatus Dependentiae bacterium]|nr:NUDIX domain-containing protein [Candidatus Dependentiae bacterium]